MKFCLKMTLNKQTKNNPNPQEPKTQPLKNCQLSKYIYHLLRTTKKKKKTDHMILLKAKIGSRGFVIQLIFNIYLKLIENVIEIFLEKIMNKSDTKWPQEQDISKLYNSGFKVRTDEEALGVFLVSHSQSFLPLEPFRKNWEMKETPFSSITSPVYCFFRARFLCCNNFVILLHTQDRYNI